VEDESNGPFSIYKGFDVRPILRKLNLKVNYHGAEAKDYVISFLDPKEYVKTKVEITIDPGGVSPESDLFIKDNTLSRSLVIKKG